MYHFLASSSISTGSSVDGGWSDYTDWTECSVECGGGIRSRTRLCNNPAPLNSGALCVGDGTETEECNPSPCAGFQ